MSLRCPCCCCPWRIFLEEYFVNPFQNPHTTESPVSISFPRLFDRLLPKSLPYVIHSFVALGKDPLLPKTTSVKKKTRHTKYRTKLTLGLVRLIYLSNCYGPIWSRVEINNFDLSFKEYCRLFFIYLTNTRRFYAD